MCEAPTTTTRTTLVTARWDHCLDDDGDDHDDGGDCRDDGGDHHDGGVDGRGEKEKDNEEDGVVEDVHKSNALRHKRVLIPTSIGSSLTRVLYATDGIPPMEEEGGQPKS